MKKFIVDTGKKKYKVTANTYDEAIKAVKCVVNDAEMYRGYKIYKVAGDWEVRSPQNEIWNYDGYLSLNEVKKLLDKGIDKGIWDSFNDTEIYRGFKIYKVNGDWEVKSKNGEMWNYDGRLTLQQVKAKLDKGIDKDIWDSLDEASPLQIVNALLEDERAAVDAYNVALENLKGKIPEESYKAIEAIRNDENRHIENLQAVVNGNVTEKNLKDATGHEVVIYTNQILSEMGLNNSIGKYDKVVQAMRSLYSESLKSGEELKEVIRRDMPRILKKYGY